jgi:hypothetical protein
MKFNREMVFSLLKQSRIFSRREILELSKKQNPLGQPTQAHVQQPPTIIPSNTDRCDADSRATPPQSLATSEQLIAIGKCEESRINCSEAN